MNLGGLVGSGTSCEGGLVGTNCELRWSGGSQQKCMIGVGRCRIDNC